MKQTISLLLTTLLLSSALVGCGGTANNAGDTATPTNTNTTNSAGDQSPLGNQESDSTAPISGTLELGGSTSVEEIVSAFIQVYQQANPDLTINYSGTGSSSGVTGVLDGSLDVGLASRALKDSEVEAGAVAMTFAHDGIAVITHPENLVTDLSREDLAKIYTKEITNWSQLGGADAQIVVVGRDAASGTRGAFEEICEITDLTSYDSEQSATGGVISTVQMDSAAIGYVSLSSVGDGVNALTIDGVAPSETTIGDGSYPIARPFIFVVNPENENPVVAGVVDWATSEDVASIVTDKGAVAP